MSYQPRFILVAALAVLGIGLLTYFAIASSRQERMPTHAIYLLPGDFRVFVGPGNTVINHPAPGFVETALPTINQYKGEDGCYIAAYSHDRTGSAYAITSDIYVIGQIRVHGRYKGGVCQPDGYEDKDISASPELKALTDHIFPGHFGATWPGGDTGGWFGLQRR